MQQVFNKAIDVAESIVSLNGNGVMMLIEFVELNEIKGHEVLNIVSALMNQGHYDVDTGNGTSDRLSLVQWLGWNRG